MLKAELLGVPLLFALLGHTNALTAFQGCFDNNVGQRFAHPRSCGLFLSCTSALKIEIHKCPKGLHFNERLRVCDLPQRANCNKQSSNDANLHSENCGGNHCSKQATTAATTTVSVATTTVKTCGCTAELNTIETTSTIETSTALTTLSTELSTVIETSTASIIATNSTMSIHENLATTPKPCGCSAELTTVSTSTAATTTLSTELSSVIETSTTQVTTTIESSAYDTLATTPKSCGCSAELTTVSTTTTASTTISTTIACGCTAEVISSTRSPTTIDDLPKPSITPTNPTLPPIENCDEACCGQPNAATLPLQGDCQRFIICLSQRQTVMTCPNNLHYSSAMGRCDFPQDAACPWSYTPPSGPAAGPSGTHCNYGGRCAGQSDGTTFPDASDACSSNYVVCQCECEVSRSCSAPLMFNSKNTVCDWPNRFGC